MNSSLNYVEFEGIVVQVRAFTGYKKAIIVSVDDDTGDLVKNYIVATFRKKNFSKNYGKIDTLCCRRVRITAHLQMENNKLSVIAEEYTIIET